MKNKIFTVTKVQLDTNVPIEVDTYVDIDDISPSGAVESRRYYPKKINFINTSGVALKANIFSSDTEIADYTLDATNYDFFTLSAGTSLTLTASVILPTAYKVMIHLPAGASVAGMSFECIGYQPYR